MKKWSGLTSVGLTSVGNCQVAVTCGVDRYGRRPMLLFSSVGMTICMAVLTLFYHCQATGHWLFVTEATSATADAVDLLESQEHSTFHPHLATVSRPSPNMKRLTG